MVVQRGQDWGTVGRPDPLVPIIHDDREFLHSIAHGQREFVVSGGDLARTLGAGVQSKDCSYRRLPIDLMEIICTAPSGNDRRYLAASHCVVRRPWWKGGMLRGPVLMICNAQFVRGRDLAPRSHPNDGKIEVLMFEAHLSFRERWKILRRSKTGDHLPHPLITFRQTSAEVSLVVNGSVRIDGRRIGECSKIWARSLPDAIVGWVPVSD